MTTTIDRKRKSKNADQRKSEVKRQPGITEHVPPALNGARLRNEQGEFWHRSAPRRVVSAQSADTRQQAWDTWCEYLAKRKPLAALQFVSQSSTALGWGISNADVRAMIDGRSSWLAKVCDIAAGKTKSVETADKFVSEWLAATREKPPTVLRAVQCLALAYYLPQLAGRLKDELWWDLCDALYCVARDSLQQTVNVDAEVDGVLLQQLTAGELALVLSCQFPEVKPLRGLRKQAHEALSEAIVELLDGEGLPRARHLPLLRPLLGCWTRVVKLSEPLKKEPWSDDAQTQYTWLVRQAIRFSRSDGGLVFANDGAWSHSEALFEVALDLAGDDGDCAAAEIALTGRIVPSDADVGDGDLPPASVNSEWSGLAMLATGWQKSDSRLTVAYEGAQMRIELESNRQLILSGPWEFHVSCDGKPVQREDDWEEQCWYTDRDCDYLEIAVDLGRGLRLERQLLLAREDNVLLLADSLLADDQRPHDWEYRAELSLAADIAFRPEKETRDGLLVGATKPCASVMPLALPEWRLDPRGGELEVSDRRLVLRQAAQGRNLCCPLCLDLKPRRAIKERTWRQLTIAELLETQPPDVAVGYRIQSGKDQWLVYRSLDTAGNRTVLGQNISSEFFAGRFLKTGEVEEFVEIETDE